MEIVILDAECWNVIAVYGGNTEEEVNQNVENFLSANGLCKFARIQDDTISAFATREYTIDARFDCVDIDSLIFTDGLVMRG